LPSVEDTPRRSQDKTPVEQTTAPVAASAPPAPAAAPASAAPAPSNGAPTWQGLLLGRLEQFKRYPALAQSRGQQGVVWLRFTMDRDGKVLSARIDKSSGHDLLDQETLALIRRAQPLPRPPPDVPGATLELVTPIEFFLTRRR
jgi:protein TonB